MFQFTDPISLLNSTANLVERLRWRAQFQPDQTAYIFLGDGETEESRFTYQQLDLQARTIAARLQLLGAKGERVLLLYPQGLDYLAAFMGCLYAGAVAVPTYPPRRNRHDARLETIAKDSTARYALTTNSILEGAEQRLNTTSVLHNIQWLDSTAIDPTLAKQWCEQEIDSHTLAFLQYTSGSTGTPKGVMVSHGNLVHNSECLRTCFELAAESVSVTWLPSFHDMGLIDGLLQPLFTGFLGVVMPPVAFLQQPLRWLRAISHYKATHSGAPNFAYELCVEKVSEEERAALDLSTWYSAYNGAEPVRKETLERFAQTFGSSGFRPHFAYPCYGMAETTLIVSGGKLSHAPTFYTVQAEALEQDRIVPTQISDPLARTLVGCGDTWLGTKVVITNPHTQTRCNENEVGEIWVTGPSVAQGYWQRPEQTAETFHAHLKDTFEGPFLRTGDLGFVQNGELFVAGRLKDLIIIRGRNHYPQDIELTVERSHPALRPGCGAAFSIDVAGEERLVLVQEVERTHLQKLDVEEVIAAIRQAVLAEHDLALYAVQLLKTVSVPKTSSGKIQRQAARRGFLNNELDKVGEWFIEPSQQAASVTSHTKPQTASAKSTKSVAEIRSWLTDKIAQRLKCRSEQVDVHAPFQTQGLDSLAAIGLTGDLERWLADKVAPTLAYDFPTIELLANHLATRNDPLSSAPAPAVPHSSNSLPASDSLPANHRNEQTIAIIGMDCRLPGADNTEALWQLLQQGVHAVSETPAERWHMDSFYSEIPATPGRMNTRWGGYLATPDLFDAAFFGISPREARQMDPQQRLLLEVSWGALEQSGIVPRTLAGSQTGVFIGISTHDYSHLLFEQTQRADAYASVGNALSIAANRLSYFYDLRGPSLAVDTACSSSLVALHLACQSLQRGESQLALVGGVNLILTPELTVAFSQAGMMAADGRCKTFSADADGYVRGEGCAVIVLKRLADAERDGDTILALVRGSALNQDGRTNGLTAPNGPAQQQVIRQALENAGVAPAEISYIEAHGTGTSLGDPIEMNALQEVLKQGRSQHDTCWIGSIKTNIGHLEAAAGIAGLIKTVLALRHARIPAHLHLHQLNPLIELAQTPFAIPIQEQPWLVSDRVNDKVKGKKRLAGVSAFGFGGSNVHVILEEAPLPAQRQLTEERLQQLLTLSAKSRTALQKQAQQLANFIQQQPRLSLADLCFSANNRRTHFEQRVALRAADHQTLLSSLLAIANGQLPPQSASGEFSSGKRPKLAFLFSGQGSHYRNMGRQLYKSQTIFRQTLDHCNEILQPLLEHSLTSLLYQSEGNDPLLNQTRYAQPVIFACEYALAQLWRSWGVEPDFVLGHSVGEYVAAALAGALKLEDALNLLVQRGRLMQTLTPAGAMAVIFANPVSLAATIESYQQQYPNALAIAALNGPSNTVVSGSPQAIRALTAHCQQKGIAVEPLPVGQAFHSPLMQPMLDEFKRFAQSIAFEPLSLPLIANLDGAVAPVGKSLGVEYWAQHILSPVQFAASIQTLIDQDVKIFVEIGPGSTLVGMGKRATSAAVGSWLPSLISGEDEWSQLLNVVGQLYTQGVSIDWDALNPPAQHSRIALPTYPFDRKRYWFQTNESSDRLPRSSETTMTENSHLHSSTPLSVPVHATTYATTSPQPDAPANTHSRHAAILFRLQEIVGKLLEMQPAEVNAYTSFLAMGADSIALINAIRQVETVFEVKVSIRQLFEETTNLDALATYIDKTLPVTTEMITSHGAQSTALANGHSQVNGHYESNGHHTPSLFANGSHNDLHRGNGKHTVGGADSSAKVAPKASGNNMLENVLLAQLNSMSRLMEQQLTLLQQHSTDGIQAEPPVEPPLESHLESHLESPLATNNVAQRLYDQPKANGFEHEKLPPVTGAAMQPQTNGKVVVKDAQPKSTTKPASPFSTGFAEEMRMRELTPRQRQHLDALIERYTQRTQQSKQYAQATQPIWADMRRRMGFRLETKEMCYPIVAQHSQGANFWDIDGNKMIDFSMGFGVYLFGYNEPFIQKAIETQLAQGIQVGPESHLAGEVAQLICEMSGCERVAFCNSGTEAVMTALRLARASTGRRKVVIFSGSYHGHSDGTLVVGGVADGEPYSLPMALGVSQSVVDDVLVLPYAEAQSLEIIQKHATELAAVVVEPVQSRRPELQPRDFLKQLRQITRDCQVPLIFDEVITGFRILPGGAQAWFGIEADLVTYGKILGGGMPIGVVAGKRAFLDRIDGGEWHFGDSSYPRLETTFAAGTFCKHPLAMAAAKAILLQIKEKGAALQHMLNLRTSQMAAELNAYFHHHDVPIQVTNFGSLFRFSMAGNISYLYQPLEMDLFFFHLLEKGIYIWEGRTCFLTTAHDEAAVGALVDAVIASVNELRQGGFFLPSPTDPGGKGSLATQRATQPEQKGGTSQSDSAQPVANSAANQIIVSQTEQGIFKQVPLLEAQKQLWVLANLDEGGSTAYSVTVNVKLSGTLHRDILQRAIQKVVNRHEALRTVFSLSGDAQIVLPSLALALPVVDFSMLDASTQESAVARWLENEGSHPFNLSSGPLFRATLICLASDVHILCLRAHHIVVDGWSMGIILQEIGQIYSAEQTCTFCELPPPLQMRDLVIWHLQEGQTENWRAQERFWTEQFAAATPALDLPLDSSRPALRSYRGGRHSLRLGARLTKDLRRLSAEQGGTLFMTLFSAYTLLLHRITNQDEIIVAITTGGRSLPGSDYLVGYCSHLQPIRSLAFDSATVLDHLRTNRSALLDAYQHPDYPFAELLNKLGVRRDASQPPLVTVDFNLERPLATPEMVGISVDLVSQPIRFTAFDLSLNVTEVGDDLLVDCDYSQDLFESGTISRLLNHFQTLLEGVVLNPSLPIRRVPLLSAAQRREIVEGWNQTQHFFPLEHCFMQRFEAQAASVPTAIAACFGDEQLTYDQLNRRANRWARHLIAQGVAKGVIVPLLGERNLDFLTAILAIWKAGGVYLPLDPMHPAQRLAQILQQSESHLLIAAQKFAEVAQQACALFDTATATPVLTLEQLHTVEELHTVEASEENLPPRCTPDDLAYVIYTSGSTGTPKGAMVEHKGMLNHLYAKVVDLKLTENDRIAQNAPQSFDISVWQFWAASLVGGAVQIFDDEVARDPVQLLDQVAQRAISILEVVPSLLRIMLEEIARRPQAPDFSHLRWLIPTGEALPPTLGRQWLGHYPYIPVLNAYGPTECSDDVTHYPMFVPPPLHTINMPIGRPIANMRIYILDRELQPVPIGVAGELCVGGIGVGQGYLHDPERTRQAFVPDPFSRQGAGRLYKTGDLARYLPDGNIVFLGRIDHQVKVRGFRIELGEIEHALAQHPIVKQAVVVTIESHNQDKQLVAYLLSGQSTTPTAREWRQFLKDRLPDYMIPTAFVVLPTLPLTPNGKVDRRALPLPTDFYSEVPAQLSAPRTPSEEILAAIWAEVLDRKQIDIHANFFDLGGHSLLAMQIFSRLRQTFNIDLPLLRIFESPTIAELSYQIDLARQQDRPFLPPAIQPVQRTAQLPLSFAQQRLWFLDQIEGANASYNVPTLIHIRGQLDLAALQTSLNALLQRHEVLRTSYTTVAGVPVQVIADASSLPLALVDLQTADEQPSEEQLLALARQEAQHIFDLSVAPLLRVKLFRLHQEHHAQEHHALCLVMHHMIIDGWSTKFFIDDLVSFYESAKAGKPASLPPLPIQYADYAQWQRHWLTTQTMADHLAYWQQQLQGAPALLELPSDRPRPSKQSFRGEMLSFAIEDGLVAKLRRLSQQQSTTLFMTLLAAFDTLLARYSGQDDIVVGTPIANRTQTEIEELIGFFVNTLALRSDLRGDPSFCELLVRVRKMTLDAYTHQELPFEQLVETIQPERSLSYTPLFQVLFVLQNALPSEVKLSDSVWHFSAIDNTTAKFDLTLSLEETKTTQGNDGLQGIWEFNTDLFDRSTIIRLKDHFLNLLNAIVENPDLPLSQLDLLTAAQKQQLLVEWNQTEHDFAADSTIHQLFEAQVAATPEAIALRFAEQQLTYAELNQRANQLAHYLLALGCKAETPIGICLERSPELIVAVLAILKAGAAYVPIDPEYPQERLAFLLSDTQTPVLLTHSQLLPKLPEKHPLTLCLDSEWQTLARTPNHNPGLPVQPTQLAYILYTSGSTGQPKGVLVEHGSLCNLIQFQINNYQLQPGHRLLMFLSLNFDASTSHLFMALCSGATLCLAEQERVLESTSLLALLAQEKITHAPLPGPILSRLPSCELPNLQLIITGGEACSADLVARWAGRYQLFNEYGPTEATVCSTVAQCFPDGQTPAIGRPIANAQTYVLDANLRPVPVGVPGELYIGGVGVARGYLNQPELTEKLFIANPFATHPARLYRTGDLVRYRPNGDLEFLGRLDHQVKIRGIRIELGEIEGILAQSPLVQSVFVTTGLDAANEKQLLAYVVPNANESVSPTQLRTWLEPKLPRYMLPSAYVVMPEFPLTLSGKVDQRRLPPPDWNSQGGAEEFVEPQTATERQIAAIWQEVLQASNIGLYDNFFERGGHSLLATQVVTRLRSHLTVEMPLRVLFEEPTIAGMAQWVDAQRVDEQSADEQQPPLPALTLPVLQRVEQRENLPLSYAQQRLWFLYHLEGNNATYNMPMALEIDGTVDLRALEQALHEVARRHEILRTTFHMKDGMPSLQISQSVTLAWRIIAHSLPPKEDAQTHAQEVRRLAQAEADTPFDITQDPLLRATIFAFAPQHHLLLLTMHHIISDGWSVMVFWRELLALYKAFSTSTASPLPDLTIQYADYAYWQQRWLKGNLLETQLNYWRQHLAGIPALLELPTDNPRLPMQSFNGATHFFRIQPTLTKQVNRVSQQHGATPFMTLLTAFTTLLHRYSGQDDIVIGTPIANRNHQATESLIGLFANTLVLRSDFARSPSFAELLAQTRQVALDAYANQDVPFEKLVEELQPARNLSYSPLFQVLFAMQNAPHGELTLDEISLGEMTMRPLELESATAKYDLSLYVDESGDEFRCVWEYNSDLFSASTIERMTSHLCTLLEAALSDPSQQVAMLPLLDKDEERLLTLDWNSTTTDYPADLCFSQLFEAQVAQTPDAIAAVCNGQSLTYATLNQRANRLAHALLELDVQPGEVIALLNERGLDFLTAMLAIFKTGAAYLPLDPNHPASRHTQILEQSRVRLVLAAQAFVEPITQAALSISNQPAASIYCLEELLHQLHPDSNFALRSTPADLAYVIYTSGSTGVPKGAMVEQFGMVNHLHAKVIDLQITANDQVVQNASQCFDISVWQFLAALLVGGTVHIYGNEIAHAPLRLLEQCAVDDITILETVPSLLRILLDELERSASSFPLEKLRWLVLVGEALPPELCRRWFAAYPAIPMFNSYGPTECSDNVAHHAIFAAPEKHLPRMPIGRPIMNTKLYVLDSQMQLAPIGVPGELYVCGNGVGRGYLNNPARTADVFVPNPFAEEPGSRLYRTGDLVLQQADGRIEYIGRTDYQVKIRGFRIELGEVESALRRYPQVSAAVVQDRLDAAGNKYLAAYIVTQAAVESATAQEFRHFLKELLPDYMIPSTFTILSQLPLSSNGKVNRKALPEPDMQLTDNKVEFVAPQSALETTVAAIWQEVLHLEKVGIHSNFFDLGGHSLLLIQIHSRLQQQLSQPIEIVDLFQYPTIYSLAQHLQQPSATPSTLEKSQERVERRMGREDLAQQRKQLRKQLRTGQGKQ